MWTEGTIRVGASVFQTKFHTKKPEPKGSGGRTGKISIGVSYTRKRRNFYVFSVCFAACYPCFCMVIWLQWE